MVVVVVVVVTVVGGWVRVLTLFSSITAL